MISTSFSRFVPLYVEFAQRPCDRCRQSTTTSMTTKTRGPQTELIFGSEASSGVFRAIFSAVFYFLPCPFLYRTHVLLYPAENMPKNDEASQPVSHPAPLTVQQAHVSSDYIYPRNCYLLYIVNAALPERIGNICEEEAT